MSTAVVILLVVVGVGIYVIAKQRGERKKAMEVMDHEEELDKIDAENILDEQRNTDAWDNLNDTIKKPRAKRAYTKRKESTK